MPKFLHCSAKPFNPRNPTRFVRCDFPYTNIDGIDENRIQREKDILFFVAQLYSSQSALFPNKNGMVKLPAVFKHAQNAVEWVDTNLTVCNADTLNGLSERTPCFWL